MEGSILKQKRKELAEIEDYEPNLARRDVLLVEIETHKTANPGDTVGLDKLYAELKTVREKIRKITGEKQGPKQQPDEIAPEITQPIATPDIKAVKIEKKERKNIDTEQKRIGQIKAELKKPLNSYSAQKLKQHLTALKNLQHWEGLKTNLELNTQIQERIADIKKMLAKPEIPTKTETKGPEETSPAPETPEGDNIPHEGLVAKEKSIEIFFHLLEQFGFITSDIKTLQDFEEELERTSFMQLGYLRSFLIERKQSYGLGVGHGLEIYIKENLDSIIKKKYMALSDWQRKNDLRNFTNDENLKDFLETLVASEVSVTSEPTPAVIAVSEEQAPTETKAPVVVEWKSWERPNKTPELRALLAEQGLSLDNWQGQTFDQLVVIYGVLKRNINVENREFINAYLIQIESLLEIKGEKENIRLPMAKYEKLKEEFETAGLRFEHWQDSTLTELYKAREILEGYEKRFPGNREVTEYLQGVNHYIAEKTKTESAVEPAPVVEGGWTPEDEQTLETLLEAIEKSKRRIVELDAMREALPITETLTIKEIEEEITEQLTPILQKNNVIFDGKNAVKIISEGEKLKLEVKLKVPVPKGLGVRVSLTVKGTIGNSKGFILLENHSYEASLEKIKEGGREKIDPYIKDLVSFLTEFLEKKYGRKIKGMQIKNNGLEVSLDAKK